jgi:hypothetical protein
MFTVLGGACGGEELPVPVVPEAPKPPPPTIEEQEPRSVLQLLRRVGSDLTVDATSSQIQLTVRRTYTEEPAETTTDLPALEGALVLRANDNFQIVPEDLRVVLGDIVLTPEQFPNKGLEIVDITAVVSAPAPFSTTWHDAGNAADFEGQIQFRVEWSMVNEAGEKVELRPLEIASIDLSGSLAKDTTGALVMEIEAGAIGDLWSWGGLVSLSDLSLSFVLAEPRPGA